MIDLVPNMFTKKKHKCDKKVNQKSTVSGDTEPIGMCTPRMFMRAYTRVQKRFIIRNLFQGPEQWCKP